ncbi:hypothetical protein ONE63_003290 [Megalurothrips usitatus]|uniref:B30.2/SPRY domain-containing protein n=1 Tax=Megalurothrips usitatus TaxID=439358 RepID=A0AAV7XAJ3_9NEOP|nr:hypothetical protein ONE63_003290 [Megalurothrips usitatus]
MEEEKDEGGSSRGTAEDNEATEALDEEKADEDRSNEESSKGEGQCYCGKERNLNLAELLCASCSRWFHESCITYQLGKLVPFMTNYTFFCKNCSASGLESFKKTQAAFPQMILTALGNLTQKAVKDGNSRKQFSKDQHIIPYIDQHWEAMTTMSRRVTQSWHATIHRALLKDSGTLFECQSQGTDKETFGLKHTVTDIKPNYEAMIKSGTLKMTDVGVQQARDTTATKGRGTKRKLPDQGSGVVGKRGRAAAGESAPKLPAHGYPLEHPFNKDGYRYILAEPDSHAPFRQEFDESNEWSGKPIPGWLYRMLSPSQVLLALHDRAPQLKVSEDRLSVTGDKGYCMIRATHSVSKGNWYFEVTIDEMPEGSATRLGWAQEYGNLQAPLGYDKFGYSWRSRKGTRFHECHGKHFSSGYGEGDTLGFLIVLPELHDHNYMPPVYKDKPLVKFKSHLYYEEKDQVQETLKNLKPLSGSKVVFFKNGQCQGEAYTDIYFGSYYPAISVHKSCTVTCNFGPKFKYPPKDYEFRGMNEKAEEAIIEQTMANMLWLTEHDGKLRLDTYCA